MPGRSITPVNGYRYGFNGMEKDDEAKGAGNSYDFGARIYDPRIGKWMSIDPSVRKYPEWSPYNFAVDNPIRYIDPDGKDPIDPRTGRTFNISLFSASLYSVDDDKPTFKKVIDSDLLKSSSFNKLWYGGLYTMDDTYHGGEDDVADRGLVKNQIPPSTAKALRDIYGKSPKIGLPGKPGTQSALYEFQAAAKAGSYTFADDAKSESFLFNINKSSFNLISVEQNYITKIVNLTRNSSDDDNDFSVNSVTTFDIQKGDIKYREVAGEVPYTKTMQKYRTLTVTETTQNYKDNKASGKATSQTYTKDEVIE